MSNLYIDIHVLQTLPPNNINRDESGSPKSAVYGGTVRQRVSSQAWKRAVRTDFSEAFDADNLGVRTKDVVELVAGSIAEISPEYKEQAVVWAEQALGAAKIQVEKPKSRKAKGKAAQDTAGEDQEPEALAESKYLIFLGRHQAHKLAELAVQHGGKVPAKEATAALSANHAVDVALFGRMVADAKELSVDASVQVAHALSVHEATPEFDYYTALDDRRGDNEPGADMIGTVEFTSSTLYRFATVNVNGLNRTLGSPEMAAKAAAEFVRSFVRAMPTGKQNTFANRTLPEAVVISLSESQPLSWVGAFEEAVVAAGGKTRLETAATKLAEHARAFQRAYGLKAERLVTAASPTVVLLEQLGTAVSFDDAVEAVAVAVVEHLGTAQ